MRAMLDVGVCTRWGIMGSYHEPEPEYAYFAQSQPLPRSESARDHCVLLAFFPCVSNEAQETNCAALQGACRAVLAA